MDEYHNKLSFPFFIGRMKKPFAITKKDLLINQLN